MADMDLPFLMGEVARFTECGIDTTTARKSLDGVKAILHLHGLSIVQFEAIRTKTSVGALTHEQALTLMETAEWSNPVV